jgi:foldase protein PrsA
VTRRILFSTLVLLAFATTACGRYLTTGVAVVNGVGISKDALEKQVAVVLDSPQFQGQVDPQDAEQRLEIERQVIVQLIQQELIRQEADRLSVRVNARDVDERFGQVRSQFATEDQFRQALEQNALSVATLRSRIREQLVLENVQRRAVGDVPVTEAEIVAEYGRGERFEELHVRHILFTVTGPDEAAARKKADAALARLKDGADFIALAKQVSEDAQTKPQGGDLGTVTRQTQFDQEFLRAAFAVKEGQISGIVRTQFGFHIIKVEDRRSKTLDQVRTQLSQEIGDTKRQRAFQEFIRKRVTAARIVVNPRWGDFNPATLQIESHEFFVPPSPVPETEPFPVR